MPQHPNKKKSMQFDVNSADMTNSRPVAKEDAPAKGTVDTAPSIAVNRNGQPLNVRNSGVHGRNPVAGKTKHNPS